MLSFYLIFIAKSWYKRDWVNNNISNYEDDMSQIMHFDNLTCHYALINAILEKRLIRETCETPTPNFRINSNLFFNVLNTETVIRNWPIDRD